MFVSEWWVALTISDENNNLEQSDSILVISIPVLEFESSTY